jgi:hypothetical protein
MAVVLMAVTLRTFEAQQGLHPVLCALNWATLLLSLWQVCSFCFSNLFYIFTTHSRGCTLSCVHSMGLLHSVSLWPGMQCFVLFCFVLFHKWLLYIVTLNSDFYIVKVPGHWLLRIGLIYWPLTIQNRANLLLSLLAATMPQVLLSKLTKLNYSCRYASSRGYLN